MPSASDRWTNDERQVSEREEPTAFEAWLWSGVHYGLAQVSLLTAPTLWLVFQTPSVDGGLKTATLLFVVVGTLTIAALRQEWVSVGRPWPRLDSRRFSVVEGYHALGRRAVVLSHLLAVVAYGSVLVATTARAALLLPVAAAATIGGVAALPWLATDARRDLLGRAALYALSVALVLLVGDPLTPPSRFRTAPAAFALLVGAALFDCRDVRGLHSRRGE